MDLSELNNYRQLARRARDNEDSQNANRYYEMILSDYPDDWEATYFTVYYSALGCIIANIASACNSVSNCLSTSMYLVSRLSDNTEKLDALNVLFYYSNSIATMMHISARSFYVGIDYSIRSNYTSEYNSRGFAAGNILISFLDALESNFSDIPEAMKLYGSAFQALAPFKTFIRSDAISNYREKWKTFDPDAEKADYIKELTEKSASLKRQHAASCSRSSTNKSASIFSGIVGAIFIILALTDFAQSIMEISLIFAGSGALLICISCICISKCKKLKKQAQEEIERAEKIDSEIENLSK